MPEPFKLTRIPSLKTVENFRKHTAALGIELPCEDAIVSGASSPLAQPIANTTFNGKRTGIRWAIDPMEDWMEPLPAARLSPSTAYANGANITAA